MYPGPHPPAAPGSGQIVTKLDTREGSSIHTPAVTVALPTFVAILNQVTIADQTVTRSLGRHLPETKMPRWGIFTPVTWILV